MSLLLLVGGQVVVYVSSLCPDSQSDFLMADPEPIDDGFAGVESALTSDPPPEDTPTPQPSHTSQDELQQGDLARIMAPVVF